PLKTRSFTEFFKALVSLLNKTGYEYAITGAIAASYYGLPRTTVDVDFIQLSDEQLDPFLDRLARFGLKVDRTRIKRQLREGYNIVTFRDKASQNRADFIIQATGEIERRPGSALGLKSFYQSP